MGARAKEALSVERIAREALALIDDEGAAAFTLERVAARLGVKAPSLYNHVASKAVIVEHVRDLVVSEMDWSMFERDPWDVALEAFARSYRAAFAAHPNTVALLYTTPVRATATYEMYEAVASGLSRGGWPASMVIPLVATVEYLIAGSVLDLSAQGTMFAEAESLGAPTLGASHRVLGTQQQAADSSFELGLGSIMIGLRAQYAALPR